VIVHLSDIHFGAEDKRAVEAAAQFIDTHRPRLVIASGDLTALGSEREMKTAFDWLRALPAPALATPGNHDTPYFELWPRLFHPFRNFQRACEDVCTEALVERDLVVAPINTARGVQWRKNWALGAVSLAQAADAARTLRSASADALKIVVTHHPLSWPPDAPISGDTRGGRNALEELISAGADLFLSGHLHRADIRLHSSNGRNAVAVSAGTLSIRQRGERAGFNVIRRPQPGKVEVECMRVKDGRVESCGARRFELSRSQAPITVNEGVTGT
jgi:3',5'-cyclic AMP phosphodiesterase CpdA